jgi:hypothetical protein
VRKKKKPKRTRECQRDSQGDKEIKRNRYRDGGRDILEREREID